MKLKAFWLAALLAGCAGAAMAQPAVPYTFANQRGNVPASELDSNFNYLLNFSTAGGGLFSTSNSWSALQALSGNLSLPSLTSHAILVTEGTSGLSAVHLGAGQLLIGQASGDPLAETMSGDASIAANGVVTLNGSVYGAPGACGSSTAFPIPTINGKGLVTSCTTQALGSAAFATLGTSGTTVPLLNGANIASGIWTFNSGLSASSVTISGITGASQCLQVSNTGVVSGTGGACGGSPLNNNNTWTGTNNFTGGFQVGGAAPGPFFAGTDAANLTGTIAAARLPSFTGLNVGGATAAPISGAGNLNTRFGAWCDPVADYGADPTGANDSSSAINSCLASGRSVMLAAGTYSLSSSIEMQPNVGLWCRDGVTLHEATSGSPPVWLIDFHTHLANKASLHNCTVDGNRGANPDNGGAVLIYAEDANDVDIEHNTFQNGTGAALDLSTGLRPKVLFNKFANFSVGGIFVNGAVAAVGQVEQGQFTGNTFSSPMGMHAITIENADYNIVNQNNINTNIQVGTVVNTSGNTVTWVSGPNFSVYNVGEFVLLNGGTERTICAIGGSPYTTMTLCNASVGTNSGVAMATGVGDQISLENTSHDKISQNIIVGGVTSAITLSNFNGGESSEDDTIEDNTIQNAGGACISLQAEVSGSTLVAYNSIKANHIKDCGIAGGAANTNFVGGIQLSDNGTDILQYVTIGDNTIIDDQGTPTLQNGVSLYNVADGQVFYGRNTVISNNSSNLAVKGGITSVSLDAGWGSTATSVATSYGDSFFLSITSQGTGQAAFPGVHVNMAAGPAGNPPVMTCQETTNATTHYFVYDQQPGNFSTAGVQYFAWGGTPVAGSTYTFLCRG